MTATASEEALYDDVGDNGYNDNCVKSKSYVSATPTLSEFKFSIYMPYTDGQHSVRGLGNVWENQSI